MDQGLTAVLGALVGVLGTLGSAWLGFHASRTQVREQAVAELSTRLREERREAYLSFVSASEQLDLVFRKFTPENCRTLDEIPKDGSGEIDWSLMVDVARDLEVVQHAMSQAVARVDLAGPSDVAQHSGDAWINLLVIRDIMQNVSERREFTQNDLGQLRVETDAYHQGHGKFMDQAQLMLETLVWANASPKRSRSFGRRA
ncbi:hypothetical protein [Streptomyces phaeochromogenes]|uniref:hypothetical protein n=1 Tax=Streptomyces phaeochromogenes TaxID=1923 RepID=UPI002DD9A5D4|nr:hypothetical protein [Streptomyces phaeochromogenes]WRZ29986.1 hypothetical protein OG931_20650 [Streptomyces phaeochromogenes]